MLPATLDDCDMFMGNYTPGGVTPAHWGVVSGVNSMRVANNGQPDANCAMEEKELKIGPCALLCCAYCKADKDCVMAQLANGGRITHGVRLAEHQQTRDVGQLMLVEDLLHAADLVAELCVTCVSDEQQRVGFSGLL